VPIRDARIPILDAGFVRSDLTYDVVGVWKGSFFRLSDHMDRLERGCGRIRLELPKPRSEIERIVIETVRRSGLREAYVETPASWAMIAGVVTVMPSSRLYCNEPVDRFWELTRARRPPMMSSLAWM
jgi:branched-subunit amino acid aminotransferase/4-amino-4-deoxychorismate lyase